MFVKAVVILLTYSILPEAYAAPTIEDSETCVKLEDCPHLLLLWSNRGKPGFPPTQNVTEVMRENSCGFENSSPKVRCQPDLEVLEDDEEDADVDLGLIGARSPFDLVAWTRYGQHFGRSD